MFHIDRPLEPLALQLGSDVPFFLVGGTAYATGRGEVITPMPDAPALPLLLVLPRERVSTAEAFRALKRFSPPLGIDAYGDAANYTNDFEEPVFARFPQLRIWKETLYQHGATWAAMSGSGSTIVGAFRDVASRDAARAAFAGVRTEPAETGDRCA
jgi:4-diphosphocytidyl-2-C-methyl-D-erythritol kinase